MNVEQVARVLRSMASGECRWIGCEGVHAYAFGSQVAGRFDAKALVFKVVTDGRPFAGQAWMNGDEAAAVAVAAIEQADSRRAPAGESGDGFQLEDEIMAKSKKVETKKVTKAKAPARVAEKPVKAAEKLAATAKAPDSPPAAKARVAAKLTKAAVKAGLVEAAPAKKRPSIVAKEIIEREGLKNTSHQFEVENVVDHKGRQFWIVKVQGFFVAEFDGIAAAKKAYPNARILGGQGCAEAVENFTADVCRVPADEPAPKPKRGAAFGKAIGDSIAVHRAEKAAATAETPEERMARLKAAARKAWETRRAQGWKHPKAKSEMLQKIDAQLAESRAISKQARETFKAIDAKKAERKKAEAMIKRVEKREKAKRAGQPIGGIAQLKKIMGEAIGL
jgi:hypothetical protein